MLWAVWQQHRADALVGTRYPWGRYLQPLELLAAEEALASSLEQDHLLGYQLVTLLLQPGDDPRLQENLTARNRGYTPPDRVWHQEPYSISDCTHTHR